MRRPVVAAVAAAALVTAGIAGSPTAIAAPIKVILPITGSTSLANPLAAGAVLPMPEGAALTGDFDLGTGSLVGDMVIPPITAKVRALGLPVLGDTTSTVILEPVDKTKATIGEGGIVTAVTSFRIALPEVRSDLWLVDKINLGGPDCKTGVITTTLTSTKPFSLTDAFPMTATFTIPKLSGCPTVINDTLLNTLMSGDGNTLDLMVGPITAAPVEPTPTPTPPAPTPTPAPKPPAAVVLKASTVGGTTTKVTFGKAGKVKVRVRPSAGATGTVRLYKGKRLLATKSLRDGRATLTLRKKALKAGKHRLRIVYSGSRTLKSSKGTVTVKVVKRR
ncbi:Ig-like domain repeat protein [Mumia sp. DW29H23]|uniref:Ig-like domain repeat protein n=1 Tax=Mumia sp. DW29H23 TaxID=3421241 RepID=UPI003D689EEB